MKPKSQGKRGRPLGREFKRFHALLRQDQIDGLKERADATGSSFQDQLRSDLDLAAAVRADGLDGQVERLVKDRLRQAMAASRKAALDVASA